ncbi:hypothetical protein HY631_02270 [Candidatus Uhrbacteria bacterium]|nr:hypothetical protein [Candidatus Uhrbacteria bacterium]
MNQATRTHVFKDVCLIFVSIAVAIVLLVTPSVERILTSSMEVEVLASFVAGIFFTSVVTTPAAIVALIEIGTANSPWLVALIGGLGAVVGDLVLFRFVQTHFNRDLEQFLKTRRLRNVFSFSRFRSFTWLFPFVGGLIIASPLPDELGVTFLGVTKLPMKTFILISYLSNFLGILLITLAAKSLAS